MTKSGFILTAAFVAMQVASLNAATIKHSFLAIDESRDSLVYTNENDPAANWSVHIDKARDMQLVGRNRVMISHYTGFAEYDLSTRQRVRNVSVAGGVSGVQSCRRLATGLTLVATEGITVRVVDSTGAVKRTAAVSGMSTFRLMRCTSRNTWLFGSGSEMVETDTNGLIVKRATVSGANNLYKAVRRPDGSYVASTGYLGTVVRLDSSGAVRKTYGGKPGPQGYGYNFFADFNLLANGHIVVSNWPGHGANDGANCIGLIEYDTAGATVWSWMDHARVSSLHAVIVLDSVNTAVLNDDREGTVVPVAAPVGTGPASRKAGPKRPAPSTGATHARRTGVYHVNGQRVCAATGTAIAKQVAVEAEGGRSSAAAMKPDLSR